MFLTYESSPIALILLLKRKRIRRGWGNNNDTIYIGAGDSFDDDRRCVRGTTSVLTQHVVKKPKRRDDWHASKRA